MILSLPVHAQDLSLKRKTLNSLNSVANDECGDCINPLVQMMPMQIGGDIPDFSDYSGWNDIKNGLVDIADALQRGFEFAVNVRKTNPCADIYYEMESPSEDAVRHIGPLGKAKYEIRSWAVIEKSSDGEQTLVRQAYKDEVSYQLVPILGRIQISHDLVALKNNQNYDSGTQIIDWIADPPSDDYTYFQAAGESTTINGQIYHGGDGIFTGEFSSMSVSGSGNVPSETLKGLLIMINVFPMDNKEVAKSLAEFGLVSWYDIGTPTETVPTQVRSRSKTDVPVDAKYFFIPKHITFMEMPVF
jgi:hypothetical protein